MSANNDRCAWKQNVLPIGVGLACAQFLGTLYVRQSNLDLYRQIRALTAANWFPVPNGPVVASLKTWAAAFQGGLFYTLSVGTVLTLSTWALICLGKRFFPNSRAVMGYLAVICLGLGLVINRYGPVFFPSLFVLGVPLTTAFAAFWTSPKTPQQSPWWLWCVPVSVLIGLTAMWSTQWNKDLFTVIRDHVLLSNPVGRSVNDFYYRNNLYAAEAFKPFQQKTIRTCAFEQVPDDPLRRQLEKTLAKWDVLTVTDIDKVDMAIRQDGKDLILTSGSGDTLRVETRAFLKDIGAGLQAFSDAGDRQAYFRHLIFGGVLIGFPVLLYIVVYGLVRGLIGLACNGPAATWLTSGVCLLTGVLLFLPMLSGRDRDLSKDQLAQALRADDWNQRVAALRQVEKQRIDIGAIIDYRHLLHSPRVVERYWLARNLANSRGAGTYRDLLTLIRDPHPNVVCQAYFGLGRRGNRAAIKPIQTQMAQSDHWYTQFYGYRAIRKLGWNQTQSPPAP